MYGQNRKMGKPNGRPLHHQKLPTKRKAKMYDSDLKIYSTFKPDEDSTPTPKETSGKCAKAEHCQTFSTLKYNCRDNVMHI